MAALDPGWASSSVTQDVTISFTLEFRAQTMTTFVGAHVDHLEFHTVDAAGATDLGDGGLWDGTGSPGNRWDALEVVMFDTVLGTTTTLSGITGSSAASGDPGWMDAIPIEKKWTNLRLGVTIRNGSLRYIWFADSSSVYTLTVNGSVVYTFTGGSPVFATTDRGGHAGYTGQGPILNFQVGHIDEFFVPAPGQSHYEHVRFGSFVGEGISLTPPYPVEYKIVCGPGSTRFSFDGLAHSFGASFRYTLDVDADETSGAAVAANYSQSDTSGGTCPDTAIGAALFFDGSGFDFTAEGHVVPAAVLADPWLSAQTVRPYDADLAFRAEGNAPRDPTQATPTDYSAGSITIASPVNVLNSATAWATDLGTVAIGGTPTVPVFTVTGTPAIVSRNLAESWRDWNTPISGDYQPSDGYQVTKHSFFASGAPDDAWGWSAYSFIDVDLTAPAGADSELAIEVTYAVLRGVSTIDTIVVNYSPVTFPAGGRSTQRVDLMFPVELASRPLYAERADKIRLVALQPGVTTLHSISLVGDEDSYLTASGRKAVLRDGTITYTGLVLTQDGAAPSLLWGRDTAVSPLGGDLDLDGWQDYRGDHQNGAFIVNSVTQEHPGKAPGMLAGTLQTTLEEIHRMEGVTATYLASAITAAFTDADGNVLGTDAAGNPATVTRGADWFVPTLPADRIASGVLYDVRAQVVVSGVVVPAGVDPGDLILFQRQHLGMTLEGLATDAAYNRHGAGVTVTARGYTGGAPAAGDQVLGAELTDNSGFALVPIRTGQIDGQEFSAYFGA